MAYLPVFFFLMYSTLAQAGAMGEASPNSSWNFEFGARYWLSANSYTVTLFGNPSEPPISRLSYESSTGNSAEGFWKLTHDSGLFIKGYFGGGSITNGKMYDEDFPPLTVPYSKTYQRQKNGMLNYLSVDLGYNLFSTIHWQLGAFLGYHYWTEHLNTFGCIQTGDNQEICGTIPALQFEPISDSTDNINNMAHWSSLRVGLTSVVPLTPHTQLIADIAYIRSHLNVMDYHNLRPDIRGLAENGSGNGVQIDGLINWMMRPNWSIGGGARWWHIATKGLTHFEETYLGGQPQKQNVTADSYGLLVQTSYQFDNTTKSNSTSSIPWTGAYVGANIGYGTNPQTATIYPTSASAYNFQYFEPIGAPQGLSVQNAGFLGGGQLVITGE